jgi:TIR domain
MSGQIFISYRRDDSSGWAGRLYDHLNAHFASSQIFMDVDNLDPGVDFVEAIEKSVGSCDVLIAVIGRRWLISSDEEGGRRLDNQEDFVRIEIATALKRGIRVIPVLVEDASMPRPRELPDDLKSLSRRNALEVSHNRFKADSELLTRAIERVLEAEQRQREEKERLEAEPLRGREEDERQSLRRESEEEKWQFLRRQREQRERMGAGRVERAEEEPSEAVFDVFLCHNSDDKPAVREISRKLAEKNIKSWLDEEQIRPGISWQTELGERIRTIKSAAVFIGKSGVGPWQDQEIQAFLSEFMKRQCPVIPAVLASAKTTPELPWTLQNRHCVDFRVSDPDPLEQLIWGITGKRP